MSWQTVFEGDVQNVKRSRLGQGVAISLFLLTAGFLVLVALATFSSPPEVDAPEFDLVMSVIGYVLGFILPFVALLASYNAIIHERQTGSIRFLLGLPNSRTEAYVGKLLSRTALIALPLAIGLVVAGAIGLGILTEPEPVAFAKVAGLVLVYSLIFGGIGLSVSAVFDSETRVTTAMIGTYVLFRAGWMVIQWGALRVVLPRGERFQRPHPEWYYWLGRINPMNAFNKAIYEVLSLGPDATNPLITTPAPQTSTIATDLWFAVVVLLVWLGIAPVLGYVRFKRRDVL